MALCLIGRGPVFIPARDFGQNTSRAIYRGTNFIDWCPTGYKYAAFSHKPFGKNIKVACTLGNSTAVKDVFARQNSKFDLMFKQRAFLHWYTKEGIEEQEFINARENMRNLEQDYDEIY